MYDFQEMGARMKQRRKELHITQNLIDTIHLCDEKELLFVQTVVDTLLKQPNKYRTDLN